MENIVDKKKFFNETGLVFIARFLAKLKGFIVFPIIVKLFGTQTYGIWAQILAIIGLATPIALIGVNIAIKRFLSSEKDINIIAKNFWGIFYFVIVVSIFIMFVIYLLSDYIALRLFHLSEISNTLLFVAFIIHLNAVNILFSDLFLAFSNVKKWIFINSLRDIIEIGLIFIIFYITLLPTLIKFCEKNKIKKAAFYSSYLLKYYFILGIPMVFGLTAISKNLFSILANQDFVEFWYIMPIIAFGIFIFQGF